MDRTNGPGTRFSVEQKNGYWYVQADRKVLSGNDPVLWGKQIENYINDQIRNGEDVLIPTLNGHILILTARSAYKLSDQHISKIAEEVNELLPDDQYYLKGLAATHIDELIQVARFNKWTPDRDGKHFNDIGEDGFNSYKAGFMNFDGKYFSRR